MERVEQVLVTRLHQRRDAMSAVQRGKPASANSHSPKERELPEGGEIQWVFCLPARLQDTWQAEERGFTELVTQLWPWPLSART